MPTASLLLMACSPFAAVICQGPEAIWQELHMAQQLSLSPTSTASCTTF